MKIITFLILLITSITAFSQSSNTNPTNCFTDYQIEQIYKGLKQNEYLKDRLRSAELTLQIGDTLIREQRKQIENQTYIIGIQQQEKEVLNYRLDLTNAKHSKEILIKENEIKILRSESKKKFWNGAKIGGIVGVAGTLVGIILVN